ncbi:hypothetical protein [Staphylococcus epidermidis]|uniref:hypothetical protein n=1 Tax=Staphylococcus epidermidis TaxID=1282 RepID=UPI001E3A1B65|nr:hypothetical protein [Staphylococcus epidermidis]MCD8854569.1 hypothetical protein [Staphylococcus epidermidis]
MEKDIINIIERHKEDINLNNNQLIIKMKCTPISKTGKELFEILNYVVQENYILTFGSNDYECFKWQAYYSGKDIIEKILNKYLDNEVELYAVPLSKTNVDIKTNSVDIKKVDRVNLYANSINSINARKFMYNEELTDTSNKDLLVAINSIEKSLSNYKEPNYNDMSVVKQFAKSSSNIASFAADVITILGPFLK